MEDPDVNTSAAYVYRVDPAAGTVVATINLAVTADKASRTSVAGVYDYYFTGYGLLVPVEAEHLTVTDQGGNPLSFEVDRTYEADGFVLVELAFRRNIFNGQTANVVVSYSLGDAKPRSDSLARVNAAYAGFEAWTSPDLETATVTIVTPLGFEQVAAGFGSMDVTTQGEELHFVAPDVDPEFYWEVLSLARESELVAQDLEVDGNAIRLKAWPGDQDWSDHVSTTVAQHLPDLIDTVGLEWPVPGRLTIIESFTPYLAGYGGWYDSSTETIEIGDELDQHLVFHEISHVWFNSELFDERWITEGLADTFAAEMVAKTGGERPEPTNTSLLDDAALDLNRWSDFASDADVESWAYGASWTVMDAVAEEIGIEGLANLVQAASNDRIAYVGDADPESERGRHDWRLFLDLAQNQNPESADELLELLSQWVLTDRQEDGLEEREASRAGYEALVTAGDGWAPPLALREAMAEWRFGDADELAQTASSLIADRDALTELLAPVGAALPIELEAAYESAQTDLVEATETMRRVEASGAKIREAHDAIIGATGVLDRIGLLGSGVAEKLDAAVVDLESGDHDGVASGSAEITQTISAAGTAGVIRIATALAVAILSLVFLRIIRRRGQRPGLDESIEDGTQGSEEFVAPLRAEDASQEPVRA